MALSPEDKEILDPFMNDLRTLCGEMSRVAGNARLLNDAYLATAQAIIDGLDVGEVVENASALAGTTALTKEEILTMTSFLDQVPAMSTDVIRQLFTKAAGTKNMSSY